MRSFGSKSLFLVLCSCIMAASGCNWDSSSYDEFVKNNDTMVVCPPGSIKSLPDGERTGSAGYYIEFTSINCYEDKIVKKGGSEVDSACSGCNDNEKSEYRYCLGYQHQNNNDVFKEGKIKLSFVGSYSNTDNQITAYKDMDKGLCPADYPRCTYVESQGLFGCIDKCPDNLVECDGACIDPNTNPVYCGAKGACTSSDPKDDNYEGMKCDDGEVCANGSCNLNCPAGQIKCKNKNNKNNNDEVICVKPSENDYCGARGTCNLSEIDDENSVGNSCKPEKFERCLPDGDSYKCQVVCPEQMILINENGEPYCDTPCPSGQIKCLYDLDTESNYNYSIGSETSEVGEETDNSEDSKTLQSREKGKNYCIFPYSDLDFCGAAGNCTNNGDGNSMGMQCDVKAGQTCIQTSSGQFECGCGEGKVYYHREAVDESGNKTDITLCLDPKSDDSCGATETVSGEVCGDIKRCKLDETHGVYTCQCPSGMVECDGRCISPETDLEFCGAKGDCTSTIRDENYKGERCETGQLCLLDGNEYRCGVQCLGEQVKCRIEDDGNHVEICINPKSDPQFCGAQDGCYNAKSCFAGQSCVNGSCECPSGTTLCGESCVTTSIDMNNCGGCGIICNSEHEACVNGECKRTSCDTEDEALCFSGDSNVCVYKMIDPNNCGGCGYRCADHPRDNAKIGGCNNGICTYSCNDGYTLCGDVCINTSRNPDHCGDCGMDEDEDKPGWTVSGKQFVCNSNQICMNGSCQTTGCTDSCLDNNLCVNSNDKCGTRCVSCDDLNAEDARCDSEDASPTKGKCVFTKCKDGFHLVLDAETYKCIPNTSVACGGSVAIPSDGEELLDVVDCTKNIIADADGNLNAQVLCAANECKNICTDGYHEVEVKPSSEDEIGGGSDSEPGGITNKLYQCVKDDTLSCNKINCTEFNWWGDGCCYGGKCAVTSCKLGYHLKDSSCNTENACVSGGTTCECEIDTVEACGESSVNCKSIENWAYGQCIEGKCALEGCASGYHLVNTGDGLKCELNTIEKCGAVNSEETHDCAADIPEAELTNCLSGKCSAVKCKPNNHLQLNGDVYICVPNTPESCANVSSSDAVNCSTTLANTEKVQCNEGVCSAVRCAKNYHLKSVGSVQLECERNSLTACGLPDSTVVYNCGNMYYSSGYGTKTCRESGMCCEKGYSFCTAKDNGNSVYDCNKGNSCYSRGWTKIY